MKKDLNKMLKAIVKNGLLEDRSEYDVDMLRDMYSLDIAQGTDLHNMIANEMRRPASIKMLAADLATKMMKG